MEKKVYPIGAEHYSLFEEVGQGVSATVHRAICIPFDEIVAVKILDFERDNCDLNSVAREAQMMKAVLPLQIEMMSESIDETLDKDEAEDEIEELTNQMLDEIGVDISSKPSSAPKGRITTKKVQTAAPTAAAPTTVAPTPRYQTSFD